MAKPVQLARCYFDDKDIHDVLSNTRFSERLLFKIAQERGIIFNPSESKDALVAYLSRIPFDWKGLQDLAKHLERPEREERRGVTRLELKPEPKAIDKALEAIKTQRSETEREQYKIGKVGNCIIVHVKYVDLDFSKAKGFQRDEREFAIELEQAGDNFNIQFTHNPRAREVVADLVKLLKPAPELELEKPIVLTGIKDPAARTNFFLKLRQLMKGFRPIDVLDLKVDRRLEAPAAKKEEAADKDDDDQPAEEVKSMVKSAALQGNGLLTTELFQQLKKSGYFLHKLVWTSIETEGDGRLMEFEAGFDDPIRATGFNYDLKRVIPSEKEKTSGMKQLEVTNRERPRVRRILVSAAYESLAELQQPKPKK